MATSEYMLPKECENHIAQNNKQTQTHVCTEKMSSQCTITLQDILKCNRFLNMSSGKVCFNLKSALLILLIAYFISKAIITEAGREGVL